jgi:hypothetical protein
MLVAPTGHQANAESHGSINISLSPAGIAFYGEGVPCDRVVHPRYFMIANMHTLLEAAIAAILGLALAAPVRAEVLITEQEAMRPPDTARMRGLTRGPSITLISPNTDASVASPFELKVKFEGHGGAKVNPDSLSVTYKRIPRVDLTQRVRPHVKADGIDMMAAEAPPGEHLIHVELKDTDGRVSVLEFVISVEK